MDVDAATQTMIDNVPAKTGRTLDEWFVVVDAAGYEKHGQILSHLKSEYGVSHGFANLIAARSLSRGQAPTTDDLVEAQYAGRKAPLRPLYDASDRRGVGLRPRRRDRSEEDERLAAPSQAVRGDRGTQRHAPAARREPARRGPDGRLSGGRAGCARTGSMWHRRRRSTPELVGWLREAYAEA